MKTSEKCGKLLDLVTPGVILANRTKDKPKNETACTHYFVLARDCLTMIISGLGLFGVVKNAEVFSQTDVLVGFILSVFLIQLAAMDAITAMRATQRIVDNWR